jgi:bifunctional enzyme CysN/CysC
VLDGDQLRRGLSSDLGFSVADRAEQARRAAHAAALIAQAGMAAIVAVVSPYAAHRSEARMIHASLGLPFFEVWLDTPLSVCEARDPKGLYAAARAGQARGVTGLDAPYEAPDSPEVRVPGDGDCEWVAVRLAELVSTNSWRNGFMNKRYLAGAADHGATAPRPTG